MSNICTISARRAGAPGCGCLQIPKGAKAHWSALNYISAVGRPGETIAINYGDLYVYPGSRDNAQLLTYPDQPRPEDATDLWLPEIAVS